MHGVHPKAKATPTSSAPSGPAGLRLVRARFSVSRNAKKCVAKLKISQGVLQATEGGSLASGPDPGE